MLHIIQIWEIYWSFLRKICKIWSKYVFRNMRSIAMKIEKTYFSIIFMAPFISIYAFFPLKIFFNVWLHFFYSIVLLFKINIQTDFYLCFRSNAMLNHILFMYNLNNFKKWWFDWININMEILLFFDNNHRNRKCK